MSGYARYHMLNAHLISSFFGLNIRAALDEFCFLILYGIVKQQRHVVSCKLIKLISKGVKDWNALD